MITMEPALKRGRTSWNSTLLPVEEMRARVALLQQMMIDQDLDVILVWGNPYNYANLAYFAGSPLNAMMIVGKQGDPFLFTNGAGRELYFWRTQTWIETVRSIAGRFERAIGTALDELGIAGGRAGLAGGGLLNQQRHDEVSQVLGGFECVAVDELLDATRATKRPCELDLIAASNELARRAAADAVAAFNDGANAGQASIAAERTARMGGARDVRILVNGNGLDLQPFEALAMERPERFAIWLGIEMYGYWADAAAMTRPDLGTLAFAVMEAMRSRARAGVSMSSVAEAGLGLLPESVADTALAYGLGHAVGLALNDGYAIRPDNHQLLNAGNVLTLRAVVPDGEGLAIASTLVRVDASGASAVTVSTT